MANRRKKKKAKSRSGRKIKSQNLPILGNKQLEKYQFAEAIKTFRQLLKNDDKRWLPLLAIAYRGRIDQLTAKGMAKEALVIYANMVNSCSLDDRRLHMNLLLNFGSYEQAFEIYSLLAHSLDKNECHVIEETLAAFLLSGEKKVLSCLPDESLIKKQYPHANQALICYCQGDFAEAESHLHHISFRSPYRNFRLALKGMLLFEENRSEAVVYLNKIAEGSVFHHWISPYRHLCGGGKSLDNLSRTEKQVVQMLEGIDKETKAFIEGVCSRQNNPVGLYSYLINSKRFISREQLAEICLRILPHAPHKYVDYVRKFGAMSEIKFERINALASEVERQYWHAADCWENVLEILEEKNNPKDNLTIAIVCRRCAEFLYRDDVSYNHDEIDELLEKSLQYDPHDRNTYFMLISNNRYSSSRKYKIINRALGEFPEDIEVLFIAIEAAIGRGAFKKASRIAVKLLDLDPINNRARLLLINAHLDHGRKLAGNGKFNLAFKECVAASGYDRANLSQGEIEIFHGLTLLLSGDRDNGLFFYDEGIKKASSILLGGFQACLEARLLEMPVKWVRFFDENMRAAVKTGPDRETFIALITKIQRCNGKIIPQLKKVKRIVAAWLKKGVKLELSRDDYLFICSVFHNLNYYDLLQIFGKKMNKLWPDIPLGTFYYFYGLSENGGKNLSVNLFDQLSIAQQAARDQSDTKTAGLIDGLLQVVLGGVGRAGRGIRKIGIIDERADVADDGWEDEEIFIMPPLSPSGNISKNDSQENNNDQKPPKQLDLFK